VGQCGTGGGEGGRPPVIDLSTINQIVVALDGSSTSVVCRTFKIARSTLDDAEANGAEAIWGKGSERPVSGKTRI